MKNYGNKLRIWECAALGALCIALLAATWAQGRENSISSELVRLHVLAVSDEESEQKIKLRVRDEVLRYLNPVLKDVKDRGEAQRLIEKNLDGIKTAAEVAAQGREVRVELGRENYPTREYLGFSLPAGNYESLKVTLGEGKGHNWWCIVFPPLCLDASQAERVQSVMSREDYAIVSGSEGYELKFRLLELWGEITEKIG